jgi:hypothetical protein
MEILVEVRGQERPCHFVRDVSKQMELQIFIE